MEREIEEVGSGREEWVDDRVEGVLTRQVLDGGRRRGLPLFFDTCRRAGSRQAHSSRRRTGLPRNEMRALLARGVTQGKRVVQLTQDCSALCAATPGTSREHSKRSSDLRDDAGTNRVAPAPQKDPTHVFVDGERLERDGRLAPVA